jgi:putative hemolysin
VSDVSGWTWAVLGLLLCCSSIFSASETALFSLSESQRARAAGFAQRMLARPRNLLVTVLVGNLTVNLLFFLFITRLHPEEGPTLAIDAGALVAILLCGDLFPKTIALRAPQSIARYLGPLVYAFFVALGPLRVLLVRVLDGVSKLVGAHLRDDASIRPEDLAYMLESGAEAGDLDVAEADLLAEIVELSDIRVREIMTPRVDATFIDAAGGARTEAVQRAIGQKLSWLPVVEGSPDQVIGRVNVRDLLNRPERSVAELMMPVKFVPEVSSALDLLRTLQEDGVAEAVVVDEWGGTAGIVTLEHVFEEIVGDLRAEGELRAHVAVPLGEGRFRVPGNLMIRDWNDRFGIQVVPTEFETVGGFVTALLGRIPRTGDVVRYGNLVLEVHEVRGRRVLSVDLGAEELPEQGLVAAQTALDRRGAS